MEDVILIFINRVTNKNVGSLLPSTSLLVDAANCNRNRPPVA